MGVALQKAFLAASPQLAERTPGRCLEMVFSSFFCKVSQMKSGTGGLAEAAGPRSRARGVCPGGREASSLSRTLTAQEFVRTVLVAAGQALASLRQGCNLFLVVRSKQSFYLATPQEVVLASEWPLFLFRKSNKH